MKMFLIVSLTFLTATASAASKKTGPSPAELKRALNADAETVSNICIDPVSNATSFDRENLKGRAAADLKKHSPAAEHDGDHRKIGVYTFKQGKNTIILLDNIDSDGAGYCDFYTSHGEYIGTMSGTESEGWEKVE